MIKQATNAWKHLRRFLTAGRNPDRLQHAAAEPGAVRSGWPLA